MRPEISDNETKGDMSEFLTRREILRGGSVIAVGLVAPRWLSTIAQADLFRVATGGKLANDTVLVVCQFSGGNDGLNTVVPYGDKRYYDCLLYTSPSPRDGLLSRMPSSA